MTWSLTYEFQIRKCESFHINQVANFYSSSNISCFPIQLSVGQPARTIGLRDLSADFQGKSGSGLHGLFSPALPLVLPTLQKIFKRFNFLGPPSIHIYDWSSQTKKLAKSWKPWLALLCTYDRVWGHRQKYWTWSQSSKSIMFGKHVAIWLDSINAWWQQMTVLKLLMPLAAVLLTVLIPHQLTAGNFDDVRRNWLFWYVCCKKQINFSLDRDFWSWLYSFLRKIKKLGKDLFTNGTISITNPARIIPRRPSYWILLFYLFVKLLKSLSFPKLMAKLQPKARSTGLAFQLT